MRTRINRFYILSVLALLGAASGCAGISYGEDDFRVHRDRLRMGSKLWTLNAAMLEMPLKPGASVQEYMPGMGQVAAHGGNTVAVDLTGFADDGRALDPTIAALVGEVIDKADDQRMAVIIRVFGEELDEGSRSRAATVAGEALKDHGQAIYWIDGPDAGRLTRYFKRAAPNLVVASAENGDIAVTDVLTDEAANELVLVVEPTPVPMLKEVHFVLDGAPQTLDALDAAFMNTAEKAPWTPANSVLSYAEREAGFIALFNERNLDGWWIIGTNQNGFAVNEAGEIEWQGLGGKALYTVDRYDDFILRLEWKINEGGNSGIFLRAPRAARQSKIGMELQLRGDHFDEDNAGDGNTGAIYSVVPPTENASLPPGEWNELEVLANGPHIKVTLNDVVVQDVNLDEYEAGDHRLREGFIGLQDHSNWVAFRNIRIKPL